MEASKIPNISPIEVESGAMSRVNSILKPAVDILKTDLPTNPTSIPMGDVQKETHVMTHKRKAALAKARGAKELKRIKLNAALEAQDRINHELGQVLSDMRSALQEFKTANPFPLANVA